MYTDHFYFFYEEMSAAAAAKLHQLCPTLATPWTVAHQVPLSMGFSSQEYWSDGMGRGEGGGFRMGNTCIPVADSF